jgi:spermidine synthase
MGAGPIFSEVLVIRELMVAFHGSEMTLSVALGVWLVVEALGTRASGKVIAGLTRPHIWFSAFLAANAALLPLSIFFARAARTILGMGVGEPGGFHHLILASCLTLFPLALLDGALYPLASAMTAGRTGRGDERGAPASVYAFEALGAAVAGIGVTFLLMRELDSFAVARFVTAFGAFGSFSLLAIAPLARRAKGISAMLAIAVPAVLLSPAGSAAFARLHESSLRIQWPGMNVLLSRNSPSGNVTVGQRNGQRTVFSNGDPAVTFPGYDVASREEFVHLAMLAHPRPENVAVIGVGFGGVVAEVLKHAVARVDVFCDDNGLLDAVITQDLPPVQEERTDSRVSVALSDFVRAVQTGGGGYDVVLLDLDVPLTFGANRRFTREFFGDVKNRTREGGIVAARAPGSASYAARPLRDLVRVVHATLAGVFGGVVVIPGEETLLLAFAGGHAPDPDALKAAMKERLARLSGRFELISPGHIDYKLDARRMEQAARMARGGSATPNSVLDPALMRAALVHEGSIHHPTWSRFLAAVSGIDRWVVWIIAAAAIGVAALLYRRKTFSPASPVALSVGVSGTTGMVGTIAIAYVFQCLLGHVFAKMGFLFGSFMAGAFAAAFLARRIPAVSVRTFLLFELSMPPALAAGAACLFALAAAGGGGALFGAEAALYSLNAALGCAVGVEFALSVRFLSGFPGGELAGGNALYAADLFGACLGAVVVGPILVPAWGFVPAAILVILLKTASTAAVTAAFSASIRNASAS